MGLGNKPDEIKNILFLEEHQDGKFAWHLAARRGNLEVLNKLWGWAEKIQIKANDLRSAMLLAGIRVEKPPGN